MAKTPAAKWRENGEEDPFGERYNCDRNDLPLGDLTDDELANEVFLHGNENPCIRDVIANIKKMPIVYLTAAKERIRWLSRKLVKAEQSIAELEAVQTDHLRLVRELDGLLNGDNAAEQASLCDIVAQVKSKKSTKPSYHDLHVTLPDVGRKSIFDLPYNIQVTCTRVGGWELWSGNVLIAGEYEKGLKLDVDGHVICDSELDDEEE